MKMKVTSEGEKVVRMLHDITAAKGFEQDTYFEMALRDIGMLPKLEGTVHVHMALIVKFIQIPRMKIGQIKNLMIIQMLPLVKKTMVILNLMENGMIIKMIKL